MSTTAPDSLPCLVLPQVVGVGSSSSGTGDVTPTLHANKAKNDVHLLFVQSDNQAVVAPTGGWAKLGPNAGIGTAAAALATRGTIFWLRDNGSATNPLVVDTGDHTLAQVMTIRGCPTTGDPFLCVGATRKRTASTTGTASAGATPVDNCLVVNAWFHGLDSASAVFSSPTNADLASVTGQIDVATADGNGGGIGVVTGTKAKAGNFAATTVTETSTTETSLTFIMLPADIVGRNGFIDRQVFLTPGASVDTWVRPTGAKVVNIQAIGGGASGSAGRNAATAAGGGGGGGGQYHAETVGADKLGATATISVGTGGAATANSDGAASNAGLGSTVIPVSVGYEIIVANPGTAAGASSSGSGGLGGSGGGFGAGTAAGVASWTTQPPGGGTGGTTAMAGGAALGTSGAGGAGGGTTQAASAGGLAIQSGAGGGGGRSNTTVGTGGGAIMASRIAGGATAGAAGTDSPFPEYGGAGGAGGTSAAGPGGAGGWPGGGGGGGGSQSGAQRGGAGADGAVTIITYC